MPKRSAGMIVGSVIHVQPWRFEVVSKLSCKVDDYEIASAHWISEKIILDLLGNVERYLVFHIFDRKLRPLY